MSPKLKCKKNIFTKNEITLIMKGEKNKMLKKFNITRIEMSQKLICHKGHQNRNITKYEIFPNLKCY